MREIKFKTKRLDNQEWIYGCGVYNDGVMAFIINYDVDLIEETDEFSYIQVIPETICQYTGLKDKNSVEIYENDILQLFDTIGEASDKVTIKWNVESAQYEVLQLNGYHYSFDVRGAINPCEKIGNIYDKEVE